MAKHLGIFQSIASVQSALNETRLINPYVALIISNESRTLDYDSQEVSSGNFDTDSSIKMTFSEDNKLIAQTLTQQIISNLNTTNQWINLTSTDVEYDFTDEQYNYGHIWGWVEYPHTATLPNSSTGSGSGSGSGSGDGDGESEDPANSHTFGVFEKVFAVTSMLVKNDELYLRLDENLYGDYYTAELYANAIKIDLETQEVTHVIVNDYLDKFYIDDFIYAESEYIQTQYAGQISIVKAKSLTSNIINVLTNNTNVSGKYIPIEPTHIVINNTYIYEAVEIKANTDHSIYLRLDKDKIYDDEHGLFNAFELNFTTSELSETVNINEVSNVDHVIIKHDYIYERPAAIINVPISASSDDGNKDTTDIDGYYAVSLVPDWEGSGSCLYTSSSPLNNYQGDGDELYIVGDANYGFVGYRSDNYDTVFKVDTENHCNYDNKLVEITSNMFNLIASVQANTLSSSQYTQVNETLEYYDSDNGIFTDYNIIKVKKYSYDSPIMELYTEDYGPNINWTEPYDPGYGDPIPCSPWINQHKFTLNIGEHYEDGWYQKGSIGYVDHEEINDNIIKSEHIMRTVPTDASKQGIYILNTKLSTEQNNSYYVVGLSSDIKNASTSNSLAMTNWTTFNNFNYIYEANIYDTQPNSEPASYTPATELGLSGKCYYVKYNGSIYLITENNVETKQEYGYTVITNHDKLRNYYYTINSNGVISHNGRLSLSINGFNIRFGELVQALNNPNTLVTIISTEESGASNYQLVYHGGSLYIIKCTEYGSGDPILGSYFEVTNFNSDITVNYNFTTVEHPFSSTEEESTFITNVTTSA